MFDITDFLSIVLSLVILEFLLSVDNALVNVSIARQLPAPQQASAVRLGIFLAAGFRVVALLLAALIIHNFWLKLAGAIYLIYLMVDHLGARRHTSTDRIKTPSYKKIVWRIAVADLVFSIDNVISAVGLSRNITYVIFGVVVGMAAILLLSKFMLRLLKIYPQLAVTGYVIVGFIGVVMLAEELAHTAISPHLKFSVIAMAVLFTVIYARNAVVRKFTRPSLKIAGRILSAPAVLIPGR